MACTEVPQQPAPHQPQPSSAEATTTTTTDTMGPAGGHHGSVDPDLECLVCREPYSCARLPKLLGCQHSFCAVCLKLLLCRQNDAWSVTCPLCRQATAVPGGLICCLRDQQAVAGRLARPCPEVWLCPQELGIPAALTAGHPGSAAGEDGQDAASANRVAARRLVAHLLLLALLVILILPFIYPGLMQWTLTFIIALALLVATLFCCHPRSQGSGQHCPRTLLCGAQKPGGEIASVACVHPVQAPTAPCASAAPMFSQ